MADMMGEAGLGHFPLEQWFYETPICTRIWTAATVIISVLVQCKVVGPLQLFYTVRSVFVKNQVCRPIPTLCIASSFRWRERACTGATTNPNTQFWRLLTTFCYFGPLSLDLLLHVFFMQRYSRLLEDASSSSSRNGNRSSAHYTWLLLYASSSLLALAPLLSMAFLGHALSSTLVYIWSRRNPDARLSFLGLVVFRAPFLPWVLIGFSFVMHGHVPKDEICGIVVGHVWYFFNDVFPPMFGGKKPFDPPGWWVRLFERRVEQQDEDGVEDEGTTAEPEDVGGGVGLGGGGRGDVPGAVPPDVR